MNNNLNEAVQLEERIVNTIKKLGSPRPQVPELAAMLIFLHAAKKEMAPDFKEAEILARSLIKEIEEKNKSSL